MPDRAYTDAEVEAAIVALTDAERLRAAQDLVARSAPGLQRALNEALSEGGWFDTAHDQAVRAAAGDPDPEARALNVRTLVAEETRLAMLVGVAIGFELARELGAAEPSTQEE
ncbi:MAG TPA: hypothetical protein VG294_16320 [Solirubrobacteraceae bacterium]|nr:hypothetical protein [Solirubrobacteraceae bacterium]